ncbi:MAG TPA: HAD family hydrolase [Bryobacteraceae bacterium]|nr:HAD family hydrolase [Bryobacteraceae bacterium]
MVPVDAAVEVVRPDASASGARVVLFDFDGTLSLFRSGWVDVMVPMMVEELASLETGESREELTALVRDFVDRLNGKQTIYQMIELARQIQERGGRAEDPLRYKHRYLRLLHARIEHRLEEVRTGQSAPEKYLVPGSIALLSDLRARGLRLYLASGTDQDYMRMEADLLGVTPYFDGGVFGALDDYKTFSKRQLIGRILERSECQGPEILAFGDGYVEIQNVAEVGGFAVGVATDEPECLRVNQWKRERLIRAGAHCIAANYLRLEELTGRLFGA